MAANKGRAFYTVQEVADRWSCDVSTVYREIQAGRLKALILGTQAKRISAEELDRFEREHTT